MQAGQVDCAVVIDMEPQSYVVVAVLENRLLDEIAVRSAPHEVVTAYKQQGVTVLAQPIWPAAESLVGKFRQVDGGNGDCARRINVDKAEFAN